MKNLYKKLFTAITSLGLLLQVSTASAGVITFDYNDTVILGDSFTVDVYTDIALDDELFGFYFDVETLTDNVSFLSATIHSSFDEGFLNDVDATIIDPFEVINGNILLASLMFSADAIGTDTVSFFGDDFNFGGMFTVWNDPTDINASFDVKVVNDVPEPETLGLFAIAGLMLLNFRVKNKA